MKGLWSRLHLMRSTTSATTIKSGISTETTTSVTKTAGTVTSLLTGVLSTITALTPPRSCHSGLVAKETIGDGGAAPLQCQLPARRVTNRPSEGRYE